MFRFISAILFWATAASADCDPLAVVVDGDFGQARFTVTVADTPAERGQGLMNVPHLSTLEGMLFVYERPQQVAFWMKNTLIALDMIFADETGLITRIHANAIPGDLTAIPGGGGVLAVLEINGGLAARLGIETGDTLSHPSLDQTIAAAPCAS